MCLYISDKMLSLWVGAQDKMSLVGELVCWERKYTVLFKKERERKLKEDTLKKKKNPKDVNYGSLTFNFQPQIEL